MSTDYVYKHKCLNIHLNDDKTQVPALFFLLEYSLFYIGVVSNEILFESTEALYKKMNVPHGREMETISAWLAICVGNPTVAGGLATQRPVTRSFDDLFDMRLIFRKVYIESPLRLTRWTNNRDAGNLRRGRVHYDVICNAILPFVIVCHQKCWHN